MIDTAHILADMAKSGQPDVTFKAIDALAQKLVGHQLFTLLVVDGNEVSRVYSNRPKEYPVGGRKPMGKTPWGDLVITRKEPFLGPDKAGIRWAFFDYELIESMGLGSVINVPIVYNDECIGAIALLDAEHHYKPEHVALAMSLAPLLIPSFLLARRAA